MLWDRPQNFEVKSCERRRPKYMTCFSCTRVSASSKFKGNPKLPKPQNLYPNLDRKPQAPPPPATLNPIRRERCSRKQHGPASCLGCSILEGSRSIHEDEVLARVLDTAIMYDGFNIANLAAFELIVRRKQRMSEAHVNNPAVPVYDGADHFWGTTYRSGGAIVVPALTRARIQEDA